MYNRKEEWNKSKLNVGSPSCGDKKNPRLTKRKKNIAYDPRNSKIDKFPGDVKYTFSVAIVA
jgi:hypothetical protein